MTALWISVFYACGLLGEWILTQTLSAVRQRILGHTC